MLSRTEAPEITLNHKIELPPVERLTLTNGINIVTFSRPGHDVNRITVMIPGAEAESPGYPEVPLVTAAMLSEGTRMHTGKSIAETIDYNGSWLKAAANAHFTSITAYSLNSRLEHVIPIITDILSEPAFPDDALHTICERNAAALETSQQEADFHATQQSRLLTMGVTHPLAQAPSPQRTRAITSRKLAEFHRKFYSPGKMTVYVAGNITPHILNLIICHFGNLKETPDSNHTQELNVIPFSPEISHGRTDIDRPDSLQSSIRITIPSISRHHPDYVPLRLAVYALGGYFGSRLMLNVREDKGLTYGINAALLGYLDGSFVQIATSCDNKYTNRAINEIHNELQRMATRPCSGTEMQRLKQQSMASLLESFDSPFAIMDCYQSLHTMGVGTDYMLRRCNAIQTVMPEEIMAMSKKYLNPDNTITVVAGDTEKIKM